MQVIQSQCQCGEPISIEIGCNPACCRRDGKRPHYPDESSQLTTVFRCRACGGWLADTCEEAAFERGQSNE